MPPKQKKGSAAKKSKKEITPLDDIDTTSLTQDKLQEFCVRVHEALVKERQYSNFLRLDRDKLTDMVAIAKEQLVDMRNRHRTKVIELENKEDNHRLVMERNRQKLINLSCEKSIECLNTTLETIRKLSHEGDNHEERMSEISTDIKALQIRSKHLQQNFIEHKSRLEITHDENMHNLREKDKEVSILAENKREKISSTEFNRLAELFKKEQSDLNARKNKETSRLLKHQASVTVALYHYYNKILFNNMSLIMVMKTTCQELKSTSAQVDKQLLDLTSENKSLMDTLKVLKAEERKLLDTLGSARKDQSQLLYTKKELEYRNGVLENMKWELETLNITIEKQTEKTRKIKKNEQAHLFQMAVKMEEFNVILDLILNHLRLRMNEADSTLAIVRQILRQRGKRDQRLEFVPLFQDTSLDELNFRLSDVIEQRELVTRRYKRLLEKHHLHMEDTGFEPQNADDILRGVRVLNVIVNEN
ncbi:dynein regulatory complex subunit 4-like [Homalodisca vitripennis]|uniref:dynein regulatory complex subunit 4-like n=1 Tax=Homalodisca vitripennis TaxID=197043 RepID=UPI001EEA4C86|nr:dynein regulatory complex subunit 4-like [Homalodisca vitripennis]